MAQTYGRAHAHISVTIRAIAAILLRMRIQRKPSGLVYTSIHVVCVYLWTIGVCLDLISSCARPHLYTSHKMDHGIVLCYAADELVHDAVGEPGSPVARGPTPAVSASRLRDYYLPNDFSTQLSEDENCVVQKDSGAGTSFFHTVFHRVSQDQYHRVVLQLRRVFITDQTPTAD